MSGADQQALDDLAESLRASDPRLARWLTGLRNRTHRRWRATCGALAGLALMAAGLPITLASPLGGGAVTVVGAVVLAASALSIGSWGHRLGVHSGRPMATWWPRSRRSGRRSDEDPG